MSLRRIGFLLPLVAGLGLLTWGASLIVAGTSRARINKELVVRAQLAASGTRWAILSPWRSSNHSEVEAVLVEMTRGQRMMAAAACSSDGTLVASTSEFPRSISCAELGRLLRDSPSPASTLARSWHGVRHLPTGAVHLSALPVGDDQGEVGFLALAQDMSLAVRHEAQIEPFLLIAFAVLSLAAAGVTLVAQRLSWRRWSDELRRLLRVDGGREGSAEFQPLLEDVHALIQRHGGEAKESEALTGSWSPTMLRQALLRHLQGQRVLLVANREPYIHERGAHSEVRVVHPASGLVTALEPVMRACSGVWVAHGGGSADRQTSDERGRLRVPPGEESYVLRRVWLTPEEEKGYYYGFANEGLWPLCHIAFTRPIFRIDDWHHYQTVNRRFAEAVCEEADTDDPVVLVQDYHFALVPRFIRERLPRATILTFWHIPWPNAEQFGVCPWGAELLEGLLGSSIMGFQTQLHCSNFVESVDRYLESRIDREQNAIIQGRRTTRVRAYPISVEWPCRALEGVPDVHTCHASVREELGLRPDALLGVGVDRLDYTKGIEERLLSVERLLERHPRFRGRFSFVQLAAPSRTVIERYRLLNESVEQLVSRINARFGDGAYRPVFFLRAYHQPSTVFRYYRAADLCYVSSLHDGMNLVAKEFVAAREDERGVLVLSHFTGAARELKEALIVNPYDLEDASSGLAAALDMRAAEQGDRMRAMRRLLEEFNVYRWAGRMLVDAARVRGREQLNGRFGYALNEPQEAMR